MPVNLATVEVLNAILARITTVLGTPPNLGAGAAAVYEVGGLGMLPARADLSIDLPAIFVLPALAEIDLRDVGGTAFRFDFLARVLYLEKFAPGANVEKNLIGRINTLAHVFLDDISLGEPTISSAQLLLAWTSAIDYRPPEVEALVATGRADIVGGVVTVRCRLYTQRF